jgi:hypothetical protein
MKECVREPHDASAHDHVNREHDRREEASPALLLCFRSALLHHPPHTLSHPPMGAHTYTYRHTHAPLLTEGAHGRTWSPGSSSPRSSLLSPSLCLGLSLSFSDFLTLCHTPPAHKATRIIITQPRAQIHNLLPFAMVFLKPLHLPSP